MDRFRKLPFSKRALPAKVIISYLLDYVILILLFLAFWALDAVEPYHQHFSLLNYTLQYPYAVHERVPIALLFFIAIICPAAIIALYTLVIDGIFSHQKQHVSPREGRRSLAGKYRFKDRLWELNCGLLGLILASSSAFVITGALKNATGKPRPDLIARCLPAAGSADLPVFGLSNSTICTQMNHKILKDGFRSFPSGHSSSSFGGLFYLSLYLAGKLHMLDTRGEVWKTFIVLAPTLSAALIAISRIMDARHHPFDVISGSLLGILTAFCAYRQYFPPLSEAWRKGRAYPIRSWGTVGPQPVHLEREVARDKGVEPMRTPAVRSDEEQPKPPYIAPDVGANAGLGVDTGSNVFRQQISETERRRQQELVAQRAGPSSNYSSKFDPRNASNELSTFGSRRGRPIDNDGYWSSSSLERESDENGYELQPKYTLTDPGSQRHIVPRGIHGDTTEDSETNTAYNPRDYTGESSVQVTDTPVRAAHA